MKRFACEMCDSGDLIKEGDYYVCQNCGTKYTLEDAKKLMTVTVDHSDEKNNLYTLARRARETNNIQDAKKYYEQLAQLDPDSWEAYFFAVYYQQLDCKIYQISSSAANIQSALSPTFRMIGSIMNTVERANAYADVSTAVFSAANMLNVSAYSHYLDNKHVEGTYMEYIDRRDGCRNLVIACASLLQNTGEKVMAFHLYESLYKLNNGLAALTQTNDDKKYLLERMHECNPRFEIDSKIKEINAQEAQIAQEALKNAESLKKAEETANSITVLIVGLIILFIIIFLVF